MSYLLYFTFVAIVLVIVHFDQIIKFYMHLEKAFFYTLGNKIKEIRLELGISIEYFSERTNISIEDLLAIESGVKTIYLEDLIYISNSLKINPSSLLP